MKGEEPARPVDQECLVICRCRLTFQRAISTV